MQKKFYKQDKQKYYLNINFGQKLTFKMVNAIHRRG